MIDPFVLLTPILLLGVMALLRFVGCYTPLSRPSGPIINGVSLDPGTVCGTSRLTVTGQRLSVAATLQWNGTNLPTFFYLSGEDVVLVADITRDDTTVTSAQVTVTNDPGDVSAPFTFAFSVPSGNTVVLAGAGQPMGPSTEPMPDNFNGLTFPPGQWKWDRLSTGHIDMVFASVAGPGTFGFQNGNRILESIVVHNLSGSQETIEVSDNGGMNPTLSPTLNASITPPGFQTITTDWTKCSQSVTVKSSAGANLRIDTITYLGPP